MKGEIDDAIAQRIRRRREEMGLSRDALAERADLSVTFLSQIELGKQSFSVVTLKKLCLALNVEADYLLFDRAMSGCQKAALRLTELDDSYYPLVEQLLDAYVNSVRRATASGCSAD